MLISGESVAVALSGGADSTALLLALLELGYDVFAVHINHNLRGEEALHDQRFCEELCARKGIKLYVESVDVRSYCEEKKCSLELGARELRYAALERLSAGHRIATAHTLSDVLETAIFNLTRGCGIKCLCGIPAVRGKIIRPLINCTREEIEEYLRCKGQGFVTDSTNLKADCSRNIIRLNVIPELKKINPGIYRSFYSTLRSLQEADVFIEAEAERILESCRSGNGGYDFSSIADDAVLSRAVSLLLRSEGIEPSYERITAAKSLIMFGGRINLKKGVYLRSASGRLSFEHDAPSEALCKSESVTLRESVRAGHKVLTVTKISPFDISDFNKFELRFMMDEAKMADIFTLRNVIGNEKIRLPHRGFTSTVKKLLADLPVDERRQRIVIADNTGAVFVEGIGVSERVCCDGSTTSAVKITVM